MIFRSYEYLVGTTTFFQCVLLIKLNAWKDEWLVVIEPLEKDKMKPKKVEKEEEEEKNDSNLWTIHNVFQIG